ncbi:hypothetical protein RIF29_20442 [Crotalaria pallida]|uniref:Uncharacterized protein n=1 Tax=Crotalaria pallida TaxID=3830 RepID=A0AAN9F5J2_CROPI
MPLWLNVYVQNQSEALVPLYGSGVEDDGQFPLGFGAVLSFRLVHFGSLKFQLMTEELLMSYSLVALKDSSVIDSKANSEVHGQGFWHLSVPGNLIEVQHLILSLLCNACAKPEPTLQGEATNEDILCRVEGNITGSAVHFHWIRKP